MLNLPDIETVIVDVEAGGLFPDDGARIGCVGLRWGDWHVELPFDQGERDKIPTRTETLFEACGLEEDPNLPREAWEEMFDWLEQREIVMHNGKYDTCMLATGTRHWPGRDLIENLKWDTLLAQRELDPIEKVGLDATAARLGIGEKAETEPFKRWLQKRKYPKDRYDLVPWEMIRPYLEQDTALTDVLYNRQMQRIDLGGEWDDTRKILERTTHEMQVLRVLYKMEHRGIGYNTSASMDAADRLEEYAAGIEDGMPFKCDVNSAKQYFFVEKGLLADRYTEKKGDPSLDEELVRRWRQEGIKWAAEYEQVSKIRRAISMWYRGYPEKAGADGRLRCYYKQAHVRSGRMSVQRIQLQAIPKADKALEVPGVNIPHVRWLLQAREGYGLWNLDLAQAELRVAAHYAECHTMLDMLLEGADFHSETTKRVLRVDETHPMWKEKRDIGKRLTFSAIFMVGGEKFQATLAKMADIHLSLEECEAYVRGWRATYPEFGRAYRKSMIESSHRRGVRLLPNTPKEKISFFQPYEFHHDRYLGVEVVKEAWNRKVQGSLAEFNKMWLVETERRWPGYAVLNVHDSIVLEAPLDEGDQLAEAVAAHTAEIATELFGVPMKCDHDRYKSYVENEEGEWIAA